MLQELECLSEVQSMAELQKRFASFLGLESVPLAVIRHALDDQYYRHNLILCRNQPDLLQMLLAHPKNTEYLEPPQESSSAVGAESGIQEAMEHSNLELVANASRALFVCGVSRVLPVLIRRPTRVV